MKISVVDLEFTQPEQEIIQIGAVSLNCKTGEISKNVFDVLVVPKIAPVSKEISELTGISKEAINKHGYDINPALYAFWEWNDGRDLYAWGSDATKLMDLTSDLIADLPRRTANLVPMGNLMRSALIGKQKGGLLATLHAFRMSFVGRQHNALHDAYNTARLIRRWADTMRVFEASLEFLKDIPEPEEKVI